MACKSGPTDAKCVTYTGLTLPCSGTVTNDTLDVVLAKMDNRLCTSAGGSVTSVAVSSTDLSVVGSPITTSGTFTLNVKPSAVTYAKIQNVGATRLIGNPTGTSVAATEISLSTGLAFSSSSIICTDDATNQRVGVMANNALIGTRKQFNLIAGSNVTISAADDSTNNRVNVTINSTGGSGGTTNPAGSDTQLQYNNAGSFGGTIAGTYLPSGALFTYTAQATTDTPLTLKAAASQSAALLAVRNSSNTLIASISASGNITGLNLSGTNTGDQTITLTGDVTGTGTGSFATTIAANAITAAKFRQSAALSVVGNATNATANVADITAGSDGYVLRRSGTTLGFGQIASAAITPAAVTYSKIQNVSGQKLLGRFDTGTGTVEEITLDSSLTLDSSTGILSVTGGGSIACYDVLGQFINNLNSTVALSSTNYTSLYSGSVQSTIITRAVVMPMSGYITNLFVLASGSQPVSGALVFTLMKGSTVGSIADTALTLTIPLSTAAGSGNVYGGTGKIAVGAGDIVVMKIVNAATAASLTVNSISMTFTNQ